VHVFDALNRQLIGILRQDGRAPLSKLAEILGVSRGTVQARLDRLIESGALLEHRTKKWIPVFGKTRCVNKRPEHKDVHT
jgi:predicted ArsR family transcriptional regulator